MALLVGEGETMFENLGRALRVLRELKHRSQGEIAKEAGVGKSQLSKYETGKELPKLESLGKILATLEIEPFQLFHTMHLLDRGAESVATRREILPTEPATPRSGILSEDTEEAFQALLSSVFKLYNRMAADRIKDIPRDLWPRES